MFEERLWQAWAEQQRTRQHTARGLEREARQLPAGSADPRALEAIERGVTELRRRNRSLFDQLLTYYGVNEFGQPMSARANRGAGRRLPADPRVDMAKRWIEAWSRENAH